MKRFLVLLPFLLFLLAAQDSPAVAISSPRPEEILRGQVNIIGTTSAPNFLSAQLDFSYASAPIETWFPLQTLSQPVFDSPLYTWDTTTITDGSYILRLRVFLGDGTFQEVTERAGVGDERWSVSAAWGDLDLDGDLDLYVCNHGPDEQYYSTSVEFLISQPDVHQGYRYQQCHS